MSLIANTPEPPYYAVIFTSLCNEGDEGHGEMADEIIELVSKQPGFLGVESARDELGITVSYWSDLESIKMWKNNSHHLEAQKLGRDKWYSSFKVRQERMG